MNRLMLFFKRYSLAMTVGLILVLATVYYFYWHLKPFTQNAFVFANTRAVSPMVEGFITEIHVRNNQFVKKGAPLFTTFQPPYRLKVARLTHQLKADEARLRSLEEQFKGAEAEVLARRAELANDRYLSDRADMMYRGAAVSQAYAEERLRTRQASEAKLTGAERKVSALAHDCASARSQIGALRSELELSKIWHEMTVVRALSDGYVTNMSISPGGYYRPGDVLFGFIDTSTWWVQANFKENELSEIRPGLPAKIWLWQYPGHCYHGTVEAPGWSAERRETAPGTGLPLVRKENEWFLLPQRFPVQIRILDPDRNLMLHHGASAYVEVEIPSRPVRQFFWQLFLWR